VQDAARSGLVAIDHALAAKGIAVDRVEFPSQVAGSSAARMSLTPEAG
jgi:hypothetical protein